MARIKITGYIDTDDLSPEQVDLSQESGLSETGVMGLIDGEFGEYPTLKATDLIDVEIRKEESTV